MSQGQLIAPLGLGLKADSGRIRGNARRGHRCVRLPPLRGRSAKPYCVLTILRLGAQWGDEGKGKLVDILAAEADICARCAGGNNAGHTIVVKDPKGVKTTYAFNLLPSGTSRLSGQRRRRRHVTAGGRRRR